jgi:two-component system sensor histidine kinase/response regulator
MAAGMNDHVAKPIEPEDLWKALLKWVKPKNLFTPDNLLGQESTVALSGTLQQAAQHIDLPSDIKELDVTDGLRRVLGKKSLYLSMLRKFVAGQKSATAEIRKALSNNDWDTAERLAHTLKGVSGNIAATGLQRLAEKLEAAIRERQSRKAVEDSLDELKMPLEMLIDQLEQALPKELDRTVVTVDREKLKVVCDQLAALLADNDAEGADFFNVNIDLLSAAFPHHYRQIEDGVRLFDFEAALAALRAATATSS